VPDEARATFKRAYVRFPAGPDTLSSSEMRRQVASMLYLKIRTLGSNRDLRKTRVQFQSDMRVRGDWRAK
jgi:hypothetical protein